MADSENQKLAEFREAVLPHLEVLHALGLRLTGGDRDRAEELVREAVLEARGAWEHFEVGTDVRSWAITFLRERFLDGFLERGRDARAGTGAGGARPEGGETDEIPEGLDPEPGFLERLADEEVAGAVDALDPELRVPLVLADLEGLGYRELADVLEVPKATARARLFAARRRLRGELLRRAREARRAA